jgi:hypothetical protein
VKSGCIRRAKSGNVWSEKNEPIAVTGMSTAHRLATIIKRVVDSARRGSIRCEEPTVDQTPEVEDTTDSVRISTLVDATGRGIPLVPCGLLRFFEGRVEFHIS